MKIVIWVIVALGVLAIVGFGLFQWMKQQPLYRIEQAAKLELSPASDLMENPWQVTKDIAINHFSTGSGRNILYVHGGPGVPESVSAPAFDALGDAYRMHYYDQRGTGQSTRPFDKAPWNGGVWQNIQTLEGTLGIAQQLADIERIRRILGDEKIIIVGHSYGGLLASLYAAEFPDRIEKLVLIAPADLLVFPSPHGDFFEAVRSRLPSEKQTEFDTWMAEYFDIGSVFGKSTSELESLDAKFANFFEQITGDLPNDNESDIGVWHVRAQYFSLGQRHDWREALSSYGGPTLIIHGENDLQTIEVSRMYAQALSNAQVEIITEAGHFPHFTQPDSVAAVIRQFLGL